jgi:hypothetical protein
MKKWWNDFINSDASISAFIFLIIIVMSTVIIFGIKSENSKCETNCDEKVHYSRPIKDRAHGGIGYGFGYNLRTHRFGYGFGTGTINFH